MSSPSTSAPVPSPVPSPVPRLLSLESRRAEEIRTLLTKFGAEAVVAPSMQEVAIDRCPEVAAFGEALFAGEVDAIVFLTGVGAESLLAGLEPTYGREPVLGRLDRLHTFVRGPKPAAVLKKWGTHIDVRAPEPNTWQDLVAAIDAAGVNLTGKTVAVQEYGSPSLALHDALRERGATVQSVAVYRWQLPDDTAPLSAAVDELIGHRVDALLLTSAQQFRHLLEVAGGRREALLDALRGEGGIPIASIGPTTTQMLAEYGLAAALEPDHPKMGPLARDAVAFASRNAAN